ncbi:MAG: PASTA domain-containing protein, partial [Oscillospiraceae bacterium]|nr:PASTA domain-containing protein [Oscillospiraceae bacterium]
MLLKDGTIKVADFGIAALENEIHENNGEAIGSVHYMAPEQARGECPDARSDIYSLGIMMYEMLTGQLPYTGDSLGEIAVKHMSTTPTPPHLITPELPPELESITLKAMNPNLNERYQSAANLIEDLEIFTQIQKTQEETEQASFEHPAVMPVRSVSELSRDKYVMRRRRSRRVSFLGGVFFSLLLIVGLSAFLWDFWLGEVFSPAERIPLPSFIDRNYETVVNNAELDAMYNFRVVIVLDTERPAGTIIGQSPEAGRSVMLSQSGIDVELTVSSGLTVNEIPDVVNKDYREATQMLQSAGFVVDIENAVSSSVTRDYVISCSPTAGEQLSTGATVYITVSSGP